MKTDLALHALEQAIWDRQRAGTVLDQLVHHSDRGVQYLAVRYTERLAENGVVNSVGSRGDSFDNALAETMIGLYKAELVRNRGRGAASTISNSRPSNGSTGSTTAACSTSSDASHPPKQKPATMPNT